MSNQLKPTAKANSFQPLSKSFRSGGGSKPNISLFIPLISNERGFFRQNIKL